MAKQKQVDVLRQIRRALRALRAAERFIVASERRARRDGERAQERAELAQLAAEARGHRPDPAKVAALVTVIDRLADRGRRALPTDRDSEGPAAWGAK